MVYSYRSRRVRREGTAVVMNEKEVSAYIEECNKLGSVLGLNAVRQLTEELGNPQDSLKFIHIAGTNGKGSVLAYLSTVLQTGGYRVGRYLSPTIFEYRERFQINGKYIGKKTLGDYMERVKEACDRMAKRGLAYPTAFEIETALAFLYFKEKRCDVVVLETGMGGRLDATNVVTTTILTVLTAIGMDHMQFLGDSLEKITREKCGIIKEGVPVVTINQKQEVMDTIKTCCKEKNVPLYVADEKQMTGIKYGTSRQSFLYGGKRYTIRLCGAYQPLNAFLAVRALEVLQTSKRRLSVKESALLQGMKETVWRGRFEVIARKPYFIVDGAHNADAAVKLMDSIHFYFTNKQIIYIMGMFKDKEYDKVIDITAEAASQIITVATPGNPRALKAYELAKAVRRVNEHVTAADSLEEAVEMASLFADEDSVIIAFGSLSFLGDMIQIVENGKTVRSDTHGK